MIVFLNECWMFKLVIVRMILVVVEIIVLVRCLLKVLYDWVLKVVCKCVKWLLFRWEILFNKFVNFSGLVICFFLYCFVVKLKNFNIMLLYVLMLLIDVNVKFWLFVKVVIYLMIFFFFFNISSIVWLFFCNFIWLIFFILICY